MADTLNELIAKWRERADHYAALASAESYFEAKPRCYKECADELEAALASQPEAQQYERGGDANESDQTDTPNHIVALEQGLDSGESQEEFVKRTGIVPAPDTQGAKP